ncbi:MAG: hypothetical protein HQL31_10805, partial [Planctomycetes bacterium]|nr:hypothetical protein [Planctomycetota bacterium]
RLILTGALCTGRLLRGPALTTTPLGCSPEPRAYPVYDPAAKAFSFRPDTSALANDGPWAANLPSDHYKSNHHLPFIQLDAAGLLANGRNVLTIINGDDSDFILTQMALAQIYRPLPDPLLPGVHWLMLAEEKSEKEAYLRALSGDFFSGTDRAGIDAALAICELMTTRDFAKVGIHARDALDLTGFKGEGELIYRLLALVVETGNWLAPEEALRARLKALKGDGEEGDWKVLASTLLARIDGAKEAGRLVVSLSPIKGEDLADGVLFEEFWKDAARLQLTAELAGAINASTPASVCIAALKEGLALGFEGVMEAHPTWESGLGGDEELGRDESVGILSAGDLQFRKLYEFGASALGGRRDTLGPWPGSGDPLWNGSWRSGSRMKDGIFTVECLIPWEDLGRDGRPARGELLAVQFLHFAKSGKTLRRYTPVPVSRGEFRYAPGLFLLSFE